MKNLLIYVSPKFKFNIEHELMAEVQIENSLEYWDKKDIILATNFHYEYKGIRSLRIPNLFNSQYPENPRAIINSKVDVIIYLIEQGFVDDTMWFHDTDAFQLSDIQFNLKKDIGCVTYGNYPKNRLQNLGRDYDPRINFGSVFFKKESLDIFKNLLRRMDINKHYEEDEMTIMYESVKDRVQIMDQAYNIGARNTFENIEISEKPLKVAHFPPNDRKTLDKFQSILPPNLNKLLQERFV